MRVVKDIIDRSEAIAIEIDRFFRESDKYEGRRFKKGDLMIKWRFDHNYARFVWVFLEQYGHTVELRTITVACRIVASSVAPDPSKQV